MEILKKYLLSFSKWFARYIGTFCIFFFCMLGVFLSSMERQGDESGPWGKIINSASFFEDRFLDMRLRFEQGKKQAHPKIILAEINDESLQDKNLGRWPWGRKTWAGFVDKFNAFGVKAIAFDVVFPEEEKSCNIHESPDDLFSKSIKRFQQIPGNSITIAYKWADQNDAVFKEVPESLFNDLITNQTPQNLLAAKIASQSYPIPQILNSGVHLGSIATAPDTDGLFRHYWAVANIDTMYFPSLGLATYKQYSKDENLKIVSTSAENAFIETQKTKIPLSESGEVKIRFIGGSESYRHFSLKDFYYANNDDPKWKEMLSGAIVFIGSTAFGAHDLRPTPISATLPGVYTHMNFVQMLLDGYHFKNRNESLKWSLFLLIIGMLVLSIVQSRKNAILELATMISLCAIAIWLDKHFLLPNGYETKLFFCLFAFVSAYSWETFLNFYLTLREKQKIRGTFSRYVAPAIVNEMLSNPDKLKVGGERREITVIFSDVRDFTSISEKLSASELSSTLNRYMGVMTDILFETYGTLDKYIGDALVGYWNAPIDVPNHAYHAIRGATKMIEALPAINESFKKENLPEFKIGIGLNTGECSVGNMGSNKIFSYTALGDNMNLGSRLEGLTKFYGVQILISEFTYNKLNEEQRQEFAFRQLDLVRVKGKEKAVKIYEVLHSSHPLRHDEESLASFKEAYESYLDRNFDKAITLTSKILEKYPEDKPSKHLRDNSTHCKQEAPASDWDGVTVYKEK